MIGVARLTVAVAWSAATGDASWYVAVIASPWDTERTPSAEEGLAGVSVHVPS
jgi:hypothetical protein